MFCVTILCTCFMIYYLLTATRIKRQNVIIKSKCLREVKNFGIKFSIVKIFVFWKLFNRHIFVRYHSFDSSCDIKINIVAEKKYFLYRKKKVTSPTNRSKNRSHKEASESTLSVNTTDRLEHYFSLETHQNWRVFNLVIFNTVYCQLGKCTSKNLL